MATEFHLAGEQKVGMEGFDLIDKPGRAGPCPDSRVESEVGSFRVYSLGQSPKRTLLATCGIGERSM
jgi:hypothetical protein